MLSLSDRLASVRAVAARSTPGGLALVQGRTTVVMLAGGGAVLHALNMFNAPSWLAAGQEGALVARAWSLLQGRELWGDLVTHAPGGVLLLSGWLAVMAGFGALADSGRL